MLNLFRRGGEPATYCALPDGAALPDFMSGSEWSYVGKVLDARSAPANLDLRLVAKEASTHGFALFDGRWPCAGASESDALDELMAEPIIRMLMQRDGVDEGDLRRLVDDMRRRNGIGPMPPEALCA